MRATSYPRSCRREAIQTVATLELHQARRALRHHLVLQGAGYFDRDLNVPNYVASAVLVSRRLQPVRALPRHPLHRQAHLRADRQVLLPRNQARRLQIRNPHQTHSLHPRPQRRQTPEAVLSRKLPRRHLSPVMWSPTLP